MTDTSETMLDIWTRHYDSLNEEKRVLFILALKIMKYQGNMDADETFRFLSARWIDEPPAP